MAIMLGVEMKPKVFKTAVLFDEDGTNLHLVDTIDHAGRIWLVSGWLDNQGEGYRTPKRIVCPLRLDFQPNPALGRSHYSISAPVSKAAYDGHVQALEMPGYLTIELPGLRFPLEVDRH